MERDYKVTYRTREIDPSDSARHETRRRLPTALDPYLYPEDRDELKRNVSLVSRSRDRYYDDEVHQDRSLTRLKDRAPVVDRDIQSVRSVDRTSDAIKQRDSSREVRRLPVRSTPRRDDRDREYIVERAYEVDRPRSGAAYIVDVRDAEVIDVRTGSGRYDSRGYERYAPSRSDRPRRSSSTHGRNKARSSASALREEGAYMSGARWDNERLSISRSYTDLRQSSRASTRYDDEAESLRVRHLPSRSTVRRDEDEWGFIEKSIRNNETVIREDFRDPFAERATETTRGRRRASTKESENDFVMVSPQQRKDSQLQLRSAMIREDSRTDEERVRQRRSRSICFRDDDIDGHCRGDKFCEKPGAEAAMMGKYLTHYGVDGERDQRVRRSRSSRRAELDERVVGNPGRSRSRRRRAKEEDEESYISTYHKKIIKDTYY